MDELAYAAYAAGKKSRPRSSERLAFVRISHDDRVATALLAARLGVFAGDAIDATALADGANRLYAMDMYQQVSYQLVEEDGAIGVAYTAVAKSWGPDFLNVGLSMQDDLDGSTVFNVFGRLTSTGLGSRAAEWRTDFQLGTDLLLFSELYQPLGTGLKYFVAPHIELREDNRNLFLGDQSVAQLRVADSRIGVDIGTELGFFGELRAGIYSGGGASRVKIGDPTIVDNNFDVGGAFAQLQVDTFDDSRFPRTGSKAGLKWDMSRGSLGADRNFEKLEADYLSAWSRGKSTFQLGLNYATTIGANDQVQEYFSLGGFLRLSGFERGRLSGPHAALGRLIYYRLVSDYTGGLFEVPVYLGASVGAGNVWQSRADMSFASLLASGSVFAAFDTYLGAIYIAAGIAQGGEQAFYLSIGSPPR
jgi:NTE family protein